MTESFAEKLCCPMDKHHLDMRVFVKQENGEITEALLTCQECGRYYPVIYGIPIMTPDEYRDKSIEAPTLKKWGLNLTEGESGKLLLKKRDKQGSEK